MTIALQAHSLVEKVELLQVRSQYAWGTKFMWMQHGCKVYMDSYMASNASCFMVTWNIFKHHHLEVGLTQRKIVALQGNLTQLILRVTLMILIWLFIALIIKLVCLAKPLNFKLVFEFGNIKTLCQELDTFPVSLIGTASDGLNGNKLCTWHRILILD